MRAVVIDTCGALGGAIGRLHGRSDDRHAVVGHDEDGLIAERAARRSSSSLVKAGPVMSSS